MSFVFPQVVAARVVLPATKSIGSTFVNLFKTNKGVRIGTGLAATGAGIAVLGAGAGSAKESVGGDIPFIIILAIIVIVLLMVMKR